MRASRVPAEVLTLLVGLGLLMVILTVASPFFFQIRNFLNISRAVSLVAVLAAITTIVLVSGSLDLSLGSGMVFAGTITAWCIAAGTPLWLALVAGLFAGVVLGLANAFLVVGIGVNAFIATIGTQFLFRGFTYMVSEGRGIIVTDPGFAEIGNGFTLGIPNPGIVAIVVFLAAWYILRFTRFGSDVYAVGGNERAAHLAGISLGRLRTSVYVLSSCSAAVAGIILVSLNGSAIPFAATGIELQVIGATILGGTALMGGRGSVIGTLVGVIFLGTLRNGLTLIGMPNYWEMILQGGALILAVSYDQYRRRGESVA